MNKILTNNCPKRKLNCISILVIARQDFCYNLSDALKEVHENLRVYNYKLNLVQAEKVSDILDHTSEVNIDFIVIVLDTTSSACVKEVEKYLKQLDSYFLIGRLVLVNGTPYGTNVEVMLSKINALRKKYKLPALVADLSDYEKCILVSKKIHFLIGASLSEDPTIPWLFKT